MAENSQLKWVHLYWCSYSAVCRQEQRSIYESQYWYLPTKQQYYDKLQSLLYMTN